MTTVEAADVAVADPRPVPGTSPTNIIPAAVFALAVWCLFALHLSVVLGVGYFALAPKAERIFITSDRLPASAGHAGVSARVGLTAT